MAEIRRLRGELEKLANPIAWLQKQAWEHGAALDGSAAVLIENTASWYREIARAALGESR